MPAYTRSWSIVNVASWTAEIPKRSVAARPATASEERWNTARRYTRRPTTQTAMAWRSRASTGPAVPAGTSPADTDDMLAGAVARPVAGAGLPHVGQPDAPRHLRVGEDRPHGRRVRRPGRAGPARRQARPGPAQRLRPRRGAAAQQRRAERDHRP